MKRLIEIGAIDIEAIKDQFPLADFVASTVDLKRKGRALVGLCPFHGEKTPSFTVYPSDQRFHCYGCAADGDLFDFAEHMNKWTIRETAEHLGMGTIPTYTPDRIEEIRNKRLAAETKDAEDRAKVITQSQERWDAAVPVIHHPYLAAKGIQAHGARIEADGTLLTPIMGQNGAIQCVQGISEEGEKLFPFRGTVSGGFHIMGGKVAKATEPVILCEGFATAASIQEATGRTVICTYNGDNMVKVARFFADRYPGRQWLVAGDDDHSNQSNTGSIKAAEAAAVLSCPYVLAAHDGDDANSDFNDMAKLYGLEAVKTLIVDGVTPEGAEQQPEDPNDFKPTPWVAIDPSSIPPREWLFGDILARSFVSVLVAPPGVGKSILTIEAAISIVLKRDLGPFKAHEKSKVWIFNNEDPRQELNRRISAFILANDLDAAKVAEGLFVDSGEERHLLIAKYDEDRNVMRMPVVDRLIEHIERNQIGLLIVDPFIETHGVNENDNGAISAVARMYREVAQKTNCAVWLVHHTRKTPAGASASAPGDSDAGRGASALGGVARFTATLFNMSKEDAKALAIEEEDRHRYVRFDDGKANLKMRTDQCIWWRKRSVSLGNERGFRPADSMGVLEWADMTDATTAAQEQRREQWQAIAYVLQGLVEEGEEITLNSAVAKLDGVARDQGFSSGRTLDRFLKDSLTKPYRQGAWMLTLTEKTQGNGRFWIGKRRAKAWE